MVLEVKLVGTRPLLMHNGRLADPLDPWSKKIKEVSKKVSKTEAEYEELGRLEFLGSLYWVQEIGPYVPAENLMAMLVKAGKAHKLGSKVKQGAVCLDVEVPLDYDGPRDPEAMWQDRNKWAYRKTKPQGRVRIVRTRPIFMRWSLKTRLRVDKGVLNTGEVKLLLDHGAEYIGLMDERPVYGLSKASVRTLEQ